MTSIPLQSLISFATVFISLLSALVALWKFVRIDFRESLHSEYQFAKQLIESDFHANQPHYVRKLGYAALTAGADITSKEAEYLLEFAESRQTFIQYERCKKYLEIVDSPAGYKMQFRPRWRSKFKRRASNKIAAFFYFVFALVATWPTIAPLTGVSPTLTGSMTWPQRLSFLIPFFTMAFWCLSLSTKLSNSEKLIGLQNALPRQRKKARKFCSRKKSWTDRS